MKLELSRRIPSTLALALVLLGASAASTGACTADEPSVDTADQTSCDGAHWDAKDRCRGANGRFAKTDCCLAGTECVFGHVYQDLFRNPKMTTGATRVLDASSSLSDLEAAQVVAAVATTYEEVSDLAAAFAAVDQGLVNQTAVTDEASGAEYVALEFGAGDNSYGAILRAASTEIVAEIGDGDLRSCTATKTPVTPPLVLAGADCAFGTTYHAAFEEPGLDAGTTAKVTEPGQADEATLAQIVRAAAFAYEQVSDASGAFSSVDQGEFNVTPFERKSDGLELRAIEYGAGDNSYGAFFFGATTEVAAFIKDGDLYNCVPTR